MSALLYTLGSFVLILLLARLKAPLSLSILAGAVAIGAMFGLGGGEIALATLSGAIRLRTVALVGIVVILLMISQTMRSAGQLQEIVSLAKAFFRRPAITMAALPALIGLLPMPGGALFSAPMVESADVGGNTGGGLLSAINYWFRHIWEHWWPLYPGVILAVTVTGSDLGVFILFQLPLGVFMAIAGALILTKVHPDLHVTAPAAPAGTKRKLLRATSTIWIILLVWGLATAGIAILSRTFAMCGTENARAMASAARRYGPITLGLLVGLVWTIRMNRMGRREVAGILSQKSIYALGWLVACVMIFQEMLAETDAAPKIAGELANLHVPVVAVVAILPFIAGMVTGLAVGFVGVSFPIVMGLVAAMPPEESIRPYIVLAYASGHLGMMMSPLHLCHVVSNRYFKTSFAAVYRYLLPPAAVTAVLAIGYFLLLRLLLK